jgi:hypothetical protein
MIEDTADSLEEISQKAHAATAYTYVPLTELYAMSQTA